MKWGIGVLIGLSGGLLGGLLGVGGGIIMIPLMTWLARATQHQAHGTSLVAIAFTASVAAVTYLFHGKADWKIAALLAASAVLTARLGASFAHSMPEKRLRRTFGFFLLCASLMIPLKAWLPQATIQFPFWVAGVVYLLIGSATGFVSGMMGVGGGVVMVPLLVVATAMSQHLAQGTSLLAMAPIAISGAITHYRLGNVRKDLSLGLAVGALSGGYFGAAAAAAFPELLLRVIFAMLGIWMAVRYIRS